MKSIKRLFLKASLFVSARRIDWRRRRDVRDAVVLGGMLVAIFLLFDLGDLFLVVAAFAKKYEDWGADDLVVMVFALAISMTIFSYRRLQDLFSEVKARADRFQR